MIRPLSVVHTTVLLLPERLDAKLGLPMGCYTSVRTTFCFGPNHGLLRAEIDTASVRTTLRKACVASMSTMVPWHKTHRTGLAWRPNCQQYWIHCPFTHHTLYLSLKPFVTQYSGLKDTRFLPVQAAGATGMGSGGSRKAYPVGLNFTMICRQPYS